MKYYYHAHNDMDPGINKFFLLERPPFARSPLLSLPQGYSLHVIVTILTQLENNTPARMSRQHTTESSENLTQV